MSLIRPSHESHWSISKWACDVSEQRGVVDRVLSLSLSLSLSLALPLQADSCQEDKQHQLALCRGGEDIVQHLQHREAVPGGGGVYPFSHCTPAGREEHTLCDRSMLSPYQTYMWNKCFTFIQGYFLSQWSELWLLILSEAPSEEAVCVCVCVCVFG